MTTYQCPALANYAALWLAFRDADLRAEIVAHRDTCEICTALREATIERRIARERADRLAREVSIEPLDAPTAASERVLPDVSEPTLPGEGEDRRDSADAIQAHGRADWSVRADSVFGIMAGEAAEREVSI
jgi:hypothetical protein